MAFIKKFSKEQIKNGVVQGFTLPDDKVTLALSKAEIGFDIICDECRKGNLKHVPRELDSIEGKADFENIDYDWKV